MSGPGELNISQSGLHRTEHVCRCVRVCASATRTPKAAQNGTFFDVVWVCGCFLPFCIKFNKRGEIGGSVRTASGVMRLGRELTHTPAQTLRESRKTRVSHVRVALGGYSHTHTPLVPDRRRTRVIRWRAVP